MKHEALLVEKVLCELQIYIVFWSWINKIITVSKQLEF